MADPALMTTWPVGAGLVTWVQQNSNNAPTGDLADMADELVLDATVAVLEEIDRSLLPEDTAQCPRSIARAIVLVAAHLLLRRSSPDGVASLGDGFVIRAEGADRTAHLLLAPWRAGPLP